MSNRLVDATDDYRINALLSGAKWGAEEAGSATEVSYSFPAGLAYWKYSTEVDAGWYGLTSTQRPSFTDALQLWADVATISFTAISDGITYGDLRIGYSYAVPDENSAYAYLPGGGKVEADGTITPNEQNGDIWLHPSLTDFSPGGQGAYTLLHEIGHAIGLKHSFESDAQFPAMPVLQDNTAYTIMSYTDSKAAGYNFTPQANNTYSAQVIKPTTPMLYDILAIQHLYGVNTETRSGDDTYTFATRGELMTIWDGGGADTIDLSNQQVATKLNLTAGSFSSVGQRQMMFAADLEAAEDNIAIAYDVEIENAIGTRFNDEIKGNALDNTLTGGAGNDLLNGGEGEDTAVFAGNSSDYVFRSSGDNISVEGVDGLDQLISIEQLKFDDESLATSDLLLINGDPVEAVPTNKSEVNHTPVEGKTAYFLLEMSTALTRSASVSYTTRDGTAVAGEDYVATSGTATLQPGQTFIAIPVELLDDGITEANEYFQLAISNPSEGVFADDQVELVAQRIIVDNDA